MPTMIDRDYVQRMARYNRWQNENLFGVADRLSDEERRHDRGAFFGSIHKTLSHLLWADKIPDEPLYQRCAETPGRHPKSVSLYPDWNALKDERARFDRIIISWADSIDHAWLAGDLAYFSGAIGRELTKPALGDGDALIQSRDPSSRPSPLPADAGRRPTAPITNLPFMPE